jgi:alpha-ribazole phosphatase
MIVLVRHPPAQVAPGLCYGRLDLALADDASIGPLAARLAGFGGTVWTSPARRCRLLAAALGAHQVDDRLQELDFGAWEGQPWDGIPRDALDRWAADPAGFAPPGGETGAALVARVTAFWRGLPPGDHRIITHGGPLKVLVPLLRGEAVDLLASAPPPGSVTVIR